MTFNSKSFMQEVIKRDPHQCKFQQAVLEVAESIGDYLDNNQALVSAKILERIVEPERIITFRVPWVDCHGQIQVNRGFRIEMNSALGPYKGGLRFHPSVDLDTLKFLAFEQVFKNALTGLSLGGGKGGSDFDPKKKTDDEVMRFCQSFMTELSRHIGHRTDIPAGDIGVGGREIGYLFGQYKRIRNEFTGVLTGKPIQMGGSLIRPEATGYGCVYFAIEMLRTAKKAFRGATVAISGSGNVAQFACEKVLERGGTVVAMSDSGGTVLMENGINRIMLNHLMDLKNRKRGRISEFAKTWKLKYVKKSLWDVGVKCDIALPCATENEISPIAAKELIKNGCYCVSEGANMPSTPGAVREFQKAKICFGPGKAANAGGVAVSGLEMAQNYSFEQWTSLEVDAKLQKIMQDIHEVSCSYAPKDEDENYVDYVVGANTAGFARVAAAMNMQGIV